MTFKVGDIVEVVNFQFTSGFAIIARFRGMNVCILDENDMQNGNITTWEVSKYNLKPVDKFTTLRWKLKYGG